MKKVPNTLTLLLHRALLHFLRQSSSSRPPPCVGAREPRVRQGGGGSSRAGAGAGGAAGLTDVRVGRSLAAQCLVPPSPARPPMAPSDSTARPPRPTRAMVARPHALLHGPRHRTAGHELPAHMNSPDPAQACACQGRLKPRTCRPDPTRLPGHGQPEDEDDGAGGGQRRGRNSRGALGAA